MIEIIKKSIVGWFFFWLTALIVWVTYASFTWSWQNDVNSWDTLSANSWNELLNNQNYLKQEVEGLMNTNVPPWAIMAFNSSICPSGWTELTSAKWRTIVGLNGSDSSFDVLAETGWAKTHTLTLAEAPSHNHSGKTGLWIDYSGTNAYRDYNGVWTSPRYIYAWDQLNVSGQLQDHKHTIPSEGWNQAHNNLQPYIAYLYCVKQ